MITRAAQLFRVTFTHVNRLTPGLLPASYDCGSVVAVEPVMCRKGLRGLSGLEPPLCAACAMAFRHALIIANARYWMPRAVSFRDGICNPAAQRRAPILRSVDCKLKRGGPGETL
jgi:hypothetical protein